MANASAESARLASQLGQAQLDENKRQYENNIAIAKPVVDAQLSLMNSQKEQGDDYYKYQKETFRPLEQGLVDDANAFSEAGAKEQFARQAAADLQGQQANQMAQNNRAMASMGVNPNSGKFQAISSQQGLQNAAARAGATSNARVQADALSTAKKMEVAGLGRGLTGAAQGSYGLALNAGNSAVGNNAQAGNSMVNGMNAGTNTIMNGQGQRMSGLGSIMGSQTSIYNANQPTDRNPEIKQNAFDILQSLRAQQTPTQKVTAPRPAALANSPHVDIVTKALEVAQGDIQIHSSDSLGSEVSSVSSGQMGKYRAKTIERIAKAFGRKSVVFFSSANETADGMMISGTNDPLYININSGIDPLAVVGHEWRHSIKQTNQAAHAAIQTAAKAILAKDGKLLEYANQYHGNEMQKAGVAERLARIEAGTATEQDTDFLAEEFSSDIAGNMWRDPEALRQVFDTILEENPPSVARSIIKSIADALTSLINRLLLSTPKSGFNELGISREELLSLKKEIQAAMVDSFRADAKARVGAMREAKGEVKQSTNRNYGATGSKPADFVTVDGSVNFGEITADQSKKMNRQAGSIRLPIGEQYADGKGYGLVHIKANHGKQILNAGFNSVEEFVSHVSEAFGQIWKADGMQLLAAFRNGKQHMMYVQLESAKDAYGDYYRVNSAFPVRQEDYPEKHGFKKLWDGSEPTSVATGQQPAFASQTEDISGQSTPNARGQSNATVAPSPDKIKRSPSRSNLDSSIEEITLEARNLTEEEIDEAETQFLSDAPEGATIYRRGAALLKRVRKASEIAAIDLGGNPKTGRVVEVALAGFSGYSTSGEVIAPDDTFNLGGALKIKVFGKEQIQQGLTAEPALTFTVMPDGELIVNGPFPDGPTYKEFKKRGWAEISKGHDGKPTPGWSNITDPKSPNKKLPRPQVLALLADVHARAREWMRDEYGDKATHVGLHWNRSTGALGGVVGEAATDTYAYFSTSRTTVDGVDRPTTNSNGKPIHPTEEGIRNFWRWFGNSKAMSMVGGESSRNAVFAPMVMFHTARSSFDTFEANRPTINSTTFGDVETTRSAIFLTPSIEDSNAYGNTEDEGYVSGANTMPVYIKIERPLNIVSGVSEQDEQRLLDAGLSSRFISNQLGNWENFDGEDGKTFVETLKNAGYDGVIFNDQNPITGDSFESWAAFSPTQIKSATGNTGVFDGGNVEAVSIAKDFGGINPKTGKPRGANFSDENRLMQQQGFTITDSMKAKVSEGVPLFSPSRSALTGQPIRGANFTLPSETKAQESQRLIQDATNRWEIVQAAVLEQGGTIDDDTNVARAIQLYPGRVGASFEDLNHRLVEPLLERMARTGATMDQIGTYLYALHATERNAEMAKKNPRFPDGGSGMTNADAAQLVANFRALPNFAEIDAVAKGFQALTKRRLAFMVRAGVMSQEQMDAYQVAYKAYVPLKGFEDMDENGKPTGSGKGFSTGNKIDKRALGRESRAGQIIENIVRDFEAGLILAEKANVGRVVKAFVEANPDAKLWEVDNPPVEQQMSTAGNVFLKTAQYNPEEEIQFLENGKPVRVQIYDKILLRAYNNIGAKELDAVWALASGAVMLGVLAGIMSDDDDDLIDDSTRSRALVIKVGDSKVLIPTAYGWGFFTSMGQLVAQAMKHPDKREKIALKMASSAFDHFGFFGNPVAGDELSLKSAVANTTPTAVRPFVQSATNTSSFGGPLYPESQFNPTQPDSEKAWRKTKGSAYDQFAKWMNSVSGGDAAQEGAVSVSPESLKQMTSTLGGGALRLVTDMLSLPVEAANNGGVKAKNVPVLKSFYQAIDVDDYRRQFGEAAANAEETLRVANNYKKAARKPGADQSVKEAKKDYDKENQHLIAAGRMVTSYRKRIASLRDEEDKLRAEKGPSEVQRLKLAQNTARQIAAVKQFNVSVKKANNNSLMPDRQ